MNAYRPTPSSNHWITVLKIIILILALYLSAIILGKVFAIVLAVLFTIIKIVLFILIAFFVLHFLLKLLFQYDLYTMVLGSRRWHK